MQRPIALDLTRLLTGLLRATPRGIDRVEFGYAQWLLESGPAEIAGVFPTPLGIRCFDRGHMQKIITLADRLWGESRGAREDPAIERLEAWLAGNGPRPVFASKRRPFGVGCGATAIRRYVSEVGLARGRPATALPEGSIYLNVGQTGLAVSPFLSWLGRRRDIKPVFMLHDVIPLEYPEYVSPSETWHFRRIVANTAQYAAGLITSTDAAAGSIHAQLRLHGRQEISTATIPLPVAEAFLTPDDPTQAGAEKPYFVCCGAIEPRKNQLLLLNVWRELVRRHGDAAPRLLLVGSRERGAPLAGEMLDRAVDIRNHVAEVSGLSTPALRKILRGARALLTPSFAEGFGIPVVEGLVLGTPVIASDLAAHREAGGPFATYVSPIDGAGWLAAIEQHASRPPAVSDPSAYRPWTWNDYFARLGGYLENV